METALLGLIIICTIVVLIRASHQSEETNRTPTSAGRNDVARKDTAREPETVSPLRHGVPSVSDKVVVAGYARVVDGDTLAIRGIQVRLFGIDAPELDHPYGRKAKWALVALCKRHKVQAEIVETDDYGRKVARCRLADGRDLSAEMVKAGMAIDWPKFSGGEYLPLEVPGVRRKLWLADARQKGRIDVWRRVEANRENRSGVR